MPLTNDLRGAEVAFALGASASTPVYALPLYSGLPVPRQDVERIEAAGPFAVAQGARKADLRWGASLALPCLPLSVGLLAKAMLWSEAVASSVHTFTPGTTQQYLTVFSRRPGSLYEKWTSGSMEELTITARGSDPLLEVGVGMVGLASTVTSAYSATTTEAMSAAMSAVGSTITADFGGGAAARANVADATVRLSRPSIVANDYNTPSATRIDHEALRAEVSLTLLFDDYGAYRAAFYASESGSTLSSIVAEGSVELAFEDLTIEVPRIAWNLDAPEASGDGGAVTATLTGVALRPASGSFVSIALTNSRSTTY